MLNKLRNKLYTLLRQSEKFTKTDMVYLARGGFWLSSSQIISTLAGFLLSVAFANLLPKEIYGTYKYILSIIGILAVPTLNGMNTALIKAVAQGFEGSLLPMLKLKIRWGAWGGLGSLLVAGYYYFAGNINLTFSFLIAAIFIPFMDSFLIYDSFLHGKKKFSFSTIYVSTTKIICTALMALALFLSNNLFVVLVTYLASYTLLRFIFLQITIRQHLNNNQPADQQAITYGKHLSLMGVLGLISSHLDGILLFHYLNPAALAVYSLAISPINQIKSLLKSILRISIPKLAEQNTELIKKTLFQKIIRSMLILSLIVVFLILILPYIYKIFFPEYIASIRYARWFAVSIIFFPERLLSISLIAHAKTKALYISNTLNPILKIALVIIFLPTFGIAGAVAALLLHQFLFIFVDIYFFKKL